VADEDGIYDLTDFNDRLILGLKGTMFEAELHFIRSRMLGGKKNKASKGELRFPLPVGYVFDSDNKIVIDPDEGVQTAVRNVFASFEAGGSAYSVVRYFAQNGLKFPKRAYGGVWDGKAVWGTLTHSRVLGIIYNPSYAGMYVFGRFFDKKTVTPQGLFIHHTVRLPKDQWEVCIPEHHPGYITQEMYEANMERLHSNRTNAELSGAAREGAALLQGLVICGKCGRHMTVRYTGNGGIAPKYECKGRWEHGNKAICTCVPAENVDSAVSQKLLQAIQPANIELSLQVMDKLLKQEREADKSWELAIERAEYEADRAERQYQQVEPENRLVARSLESRWNEKLTALRQLEEDHKKYKTDHKWNPSENDKAEILTLSKELPQIWNSPTTTARDRKRVIRTLVEDITIFATARQPEIRIGIRWRNQFTEEIYALKPIPFGTYRQHLPETIELIRQLALKMNDQQIVSYLNDAAIKTPEGRTFTISSIKWIRYRHDIPPFSLERNGLTVKDTAAKFGVGIATVYYWIEHGMVNAKKTGIYQSWDIIIDDLKCDELHAWVQNSGHLNKIRAVINKTGKQGCE